MRNILKLCQIPSFFPFYYNCTDVKFLRFNKINFKWIYWDKFFFNTSFENFKMYYIEFLLYKINHNFQNTMNYTISHKSKYYDAFRVHNKYIWYCRSKLATFIHYLLLKNDRFIIISFTNILCSIFISSFSY